MAALDHIHGFVHRLQQDRDLRARFEADPAAVLNDEPLQPEERALLDAGDFGALGQLGMHPLAQMVYGLARNPAMIEQISFRDYLGDLAEDAR
jgi:hypothetical protein